MLSIVEW